jgi:hypothetical protein
MLLPRFRWFVAYTLTVFLGLAALVLFVPPPRPLLRQLALYSSDTLMRGESGAGARLLRGFVQSSIAAHMANDAAAEGGSDEEILMRMMLRVRRTVLNARNELDTRYDARHWPALVSGLGYCDQINGAVCSVAAHRFGRVELFALYDRVNLASPHTIGRVWSERRGEWLYFDAAFATPVVFTKDAAGKPHIVRSEPRSPFSPREDVPPGSYDLPGWPMARFPRTFAMYIYYRLRPPFDRQIVAGADGEASSANAGVLTTPPVLTLAATSYPPERADARRSDAVYQRVAREYLEARIDHLLGIPSRDAYRAVASADAVEDDRATEMIVAARRFAARPQL